MMKSSENRLMYKHRFYIPYEHDESLCWEVDVFKGDNEGLIIAEIELDTESHELVIPTWIGNEVTHDMRYTNVHLNYYPYKSWK